jgi:hypothetical protein
VLPTKSQVDALNNDAKKMAKKNMSHVERHQSDFCGVSKELT